MTTTNTFQGMDLEKPSSKVLAPPGGKSNIFFGGASEGDQPKQPKSQPAQQKTQAAPVQQDCSPAKSAKPQNSAGQTQMNIFGGGDPNTPKPPCGKRRFSNQNNSGFNLLSGEPSTPPTKSNGAGARQMQDRVDPANLPAAGGRIEERQVTRKMPPGGASSFSFGN